MMYRVHFVALLLMLPLAGCAETAKKAEKSEVDVIKASLDKLSPEDRQLAEVQKYCPDSKEPLGSMGTPVKLMVKDQPVFICCKGCSKEALSDPDKTLAKVDELKKKAAAEASK